MPDRLNSRFEVHFATYSSSVNDFTTHAPKKHRSAHYSQVGARKLRTLKIRAYRTLSS